MPRTLEKRERSLGEKLFLKGDRCSGAKCVMVRRNYPPGIHGKAVTIPSYRVRAGEVISIKERALAGGSFSDLENRLKKHQAPLWLELDSSKKTGTVLRAPEVEELETIFDVTKIKELYSR